MAHFSSQGFPCLFSFNVDGIPRSTANAALGPGILQLHAVGDLIPARRADRGTDNSKSTSSACASNHGETAGTCAFSLMTVGLAQVEPDDWAGLKDRLTRGTSRSAGMQRRDPQGELTRLTHATPSQPPNKTSPKTHRLSGKVRTFRTRAVASNWCTPPGPPRTLPRARMHNHDMARKFLASQRAGSLAWPRLEYTPPHLPLPAPLSPPAPLRSHKKKKEESHV